MQRERVNLAQRDAAVSRRSVLRAAAATLGGMLVGVGDGRAASPPVAAATAPVERPWWLDTPDGRSRVVEIRSRAVLNGSVVDPHELGRMKDQALETLTRRGETSAAWRSILGPAKRIVIKFNRVGAAIISTADATARALFQALMAAGYTPEQITLVEAPEYLTKRLGTRPPPRGWGETIPVGDRAEPLCNYLLECEALINVPFLKTHQIAGMSAAMKNISHAVIAHPARFHANACSPFVGQVIGNKQVRDRLRLQIVDALRIVFRNGPDASEDDIRSFGGLVLGFDPVAVDSVSLGILERERRDAGLPEPVEVPYLARAASDGVGRIKSHDIEHVRVDAGT